MRKYLSLAMAAASVVAIVSAMTPAEAATTHVLTIGKAGGTAVKTKAVLKAGLPSGKSAVFTIGSAKLTCTSASESAKVTSNPVKPGTAKESLTAQSFSKCKISVSGVTLKSLKAGNLPYNVSVSDAKGDPVTVSGTSKSKPLSVTATVAVGTSTLSCTYTAAKITGHASNKGNVVTFSKQKFTFASGGSLCTALGSSAAFSATIGPVTDSSVKGDPKVFVN